MDVTSINTDLDVSSKYKELVEMATDGDSIYIRAKETLEKLWESGDIDAGSKAEVTVQIFSALNNAVVTNAMSTALQWEAQEKQLEIAKMKLEYELDLLKAQAETQAIATDTEMAKKQLTQAQVIRQYGKPVIGSDTNVLTLAAEGQIYEQILLTREEVTNKAQEFKNLEAVEKKTYTDIHRLVADTYVNHGMYSGYSILPTGITGTSKISSHKTLSDYQSNIASVQAKGYAYNAWGNAATSAASMIGVLLSSGEGTAITPSDVALWRSSVNKLNTIEALSIAGDTSYITVSTELYKNGVNIGTGSVVVTPTGALSVKVSTTGTCTVMLYNTKTSTWAKVGTMETTNDSVTFSIGTDVIAGDYSYVAQILDQYGRTAYSNTLMFTVAAPVV